jgi:hypothetical protein
MIASFTFWQSWWSARSVVVVEVNGYKIEPGAEPEELWPILQAQGLLG